MLINLELKIKNSEWMRRAIENSELKDFKKRLRFELKGVWFLRRSSVFFIVICIKPYTSFLWHWCWLDKFFDGLDDGSNLIVMT